MAWGAYLGSRVNGPTLFSFVPQIVLKALVVVGQAEQRLAVESLKWACIVVLVVGRRRRNHTLSL